MVLKCLFLDLIETLTQSLLRFSTPLVTPTPAAAPLIAVDRAGCSLHPGGRNTDVFSCLQPGVEYTTMGQRFDDASWLYLNDLKRHGCPHKRGCGLGPVGGLWLAGYFRNLRLPHFRARPNRRRWQSRRPQISVELEEGAERKELRSPWCHQDHISDALRFGEPYLGTHEFGFQRVLDQQVESQASWCGPTFRDLSETKLRHVHFTGLSGGWPATTRNTSSAAASPIFRNASSVRAALWGVIMTLSNSNSG
jgi:hypothetical protein